MLDPHQRRAFWRKRLPILNWLPQYDLRRDLKHDVIAGFTVGVMLVPQEMSLAAMMGVPGQYGLYTAAIAPLIYPIFGSSRALSVANASEGSLLVGVMLHSVDIHTVAERVATGILLTFLSGVLMVLGGLVHQGGLVSFFSRTSMNGYVTATAVLIVLSQIPPWLGFTLSTPNLTVLTAIEIATKLPETNPNSLLLGLFSLLVLALCKSFRAQLQQIADARACSRNLLRASHDSASLNPPHEDDSDVDEAAVDVQLHDSSDVRTSNTGTWQLKRTGRAGSSRSAAVADRACLMMQQTAPSPDVGFLANLLTQRPRALFWCTLLCDSGGLLVCVAGIFVGASLGEDRLRLTGAVHKGLPTPVFPPAALGTLVPWDRVNLLVTNSVVIAIIFFMSSVATGSKLAAKDGYEISPNQELLGLGFANLGASFFQGMPSCAGMSRSAVNSQSAHTPLASMITALLVILAMLFLTGPLYYLPQAPLAALILLSSVALIDFSEPKWLFQVRRNEFFVWAGAFAGTLCVGLVNGLAVALLASLVDIMARTKKPEVFVLGQLRDGSFAKLTPPDSARQQDGEEGEGDDDDGQDVARERPTELRDVVVVRMEQDLYFGNARHLIHAIERDLKTAKARGRVLGAVIDGSRMNDVDATAMHLLQEYQLKLAGRDQTLLFANVRRETETAIIESGLAPPLERARRGSAGEDEGEATDCHLQRHRPSDSVASAVAFLRLQ
ncbi:hypothetical protein PybrP1_007827 [[Pythium] brassicae (nom. inval.)]|nr:hypothetical protein PybrP1_007827 [[Pythium] brassicae (nom. inval.)]